MKKRILSVLLASVLATSLVACQANTDTSKKDSSVAGDTASTSSTEKIKLTVPCIGYNDDQIAAAKTKEGGIVPSDEVYIAVRDEIEKTHPEYEVEWVDWGWAETLDQKQRSLISAGAAPDIVAGETFMPTYANEGVLEPLPQDIVDAVNPSFLISNPENKPVAVAFKSSLFMLFYNKELMKKAGLDPEQPPQTWAELKEMSDKVTAAGKGQFYGGGIPTFPHAGGSLRATPFFRQNGTDFAKDGKSNLNDVKLQETLQYVRDMNANFPAGLGNAADEGPLWNAFEKEKTIAFVINGAWQAAGAQRQGIDWGVVPLPLPEGGVEGNCMVGSVYTAVTKDSKNKEAAFNVIRAALKEDIQKMWLRDTVCVPLKSIIANKELYKDDKTLSTAMEALENGKYSGLAAFAKNDSQVWEIINTKVLARTTMTNDPIDKICQDANNEIEPLLK